MEFKSLTMRIWITYTAIILSIILGINLFYTVAYKEISENTKKKDLLAIHNIILNNNLKQPTGYEDFQILFDISHLIIRDGQIKKSSKSNFFREMAAEQNQQLGNKKSNNTNLLPRIRQPSILKDKKLENWISSFAKGKMSDKQFKESYEGLSFLFVISSTDNGYLISYTPDLYDNSLLYILLVIGGIFTVVGFFVAKIVANYITTPLKELENFSKRIAAKNFNEPIIVANQDEIGRLAASMNKMQEDLKRADEEEKLFLQSISHGYFKGEPPLDFWKVQAVYVAHASLFSIEWATKFGQSDIDNMTSICMRAFKDYDNFERIIPRWYEDNVKQWS